MKYFSKVVFTLFLVTLLISCPSLEYNPDVRAEMISELHELLAEEGAIAIVPMIGAGVTRNTITANTGFAADRLQEAYPKKKILITDPQYSGSDSVFKPSDFLRDVESDMDVSVIFYVHEMIGTSPTTGRRERKIQIFIFNRRSSHFIPSDLNFGGYVKYTISQSGGIFSRWQNQFAALVHEISTDTTLTINERASYEW